MENSTYKQRVPLSSVWDGGCGWCSAAQSCLTLLQPNDCSTPGFPVLHYLLEFVLIHVH